MDIAEKIKETIGFLNDIEKLEDSSIKVQSDTDQKTQDLLHCLEFGKFRSYEYMRIALEIKKVRKDRRQAKDDLEIIRVFKQNLLQLQSSQGREMLNNIIQKQIKENKRYYKNRAYTSEELQEIVKLNKK